MTWLLAADTWIDVAEWGIAGAVVVGLYYVWAKWGGGIDERADHEDRLRRRRMDEEVERDGR